MILGNMVSTRSNVTTVLVKIINCLFFCFFFLDTLEPAKMTIESVRTVLDLRSKEKLPEVTDISTTMFIVHWLEDALLAVIALLTRTDIPAAEIPTVRSVGLDFHNGKKKGFVFPVLVSNCSTCLLCTFRGGLQSGPLSVARILPLAHSLALLGVMVHEKTKDCKFSSEPHALTAAHDALAILRLVLVQTPAGDDVAAALRRAKLTLPDQRFQRMPIDAMLRALGISTGFPLGEYSV